MRVLCGVKRPAAKDPHLDLSPSDALQHKLVPHHATRTALQHSGNSSWKHTSRSRAAASPSGTAEKEEQTVTRSCERVTSQLINVLGTSARSQQAGVGGERAEPRIVGTREQ